MCSRTAGATCVSRSFSVRIGIDGHAGERERGGASPEEVASMHGGHYIRGSAGRRSW
jgi:hypothetical protein